jgi:hypothetical protein
MVKLPRRMKGVDKSKPENMTLDENIQADIQPLVPQVIREVSL